MTPPIPDLAQRFAKNPLLRPSDLKPSRDGLEITCLLNPGVFTFEGKTWLVMRVAERPHQSDTHISFPILSPTGEMSIKTIDRKDPELDAKDPRVIRYRGKDYLTTLSQLRFLMSDDGKSFRESPSHPALTGLGKYETFGIEDCRVTQLDGEFYMTYTAVSESGVAVGLRKTRDFKTFDNPILILPPHNKDCAIFEEKIDGKFFALHRPSSVDLGGNYIWLASSPDGIHWGHHHCLAQTRDGLWDSKRVGAGAAPIRTERGWLAIYHGANEKHQYCLGGLLLDIKDPSKVLARSVEPIMMPMAEYEKTGFFGNVVFTNGHVVNGDRVTIYYGASDEVVCGADFSIKEILETLR